jgi:hypothetical protein
METHYRVVFAGRIQAGLDLALVKQEAGTRLKASPEQLDQLFSLPRVILKKDVEGAYGHAYVAALREIGMLVELEPLQQEAPSVHIEPPHPAQPPFSSPQESQLTSALGAEEAPAVAKAPSQTPRHSVTTPAEENVIIQDSPAPLAFATANPEQTGSDLANTLAPLDTAHTPPATEAAPANPLTSSYERMQANLARAEAVLNASRKPAESLVTAPEPPLFVRAAETPPAATPAALPASSLGVSVDTTVSPALSPAEPPQQLLAKAPLLFRTTIECSECGTPHIIEGRLMVTVVPSVETPAKI